MGPVEHPEEPEEGAPARDHLSGSTRASGRAAASQRMSSV